MSCGAGASRLIEAIHGGFEQLGCSVSLGRTRSQNRSRALNLRVGRRLAESVGCHGHRGGGTDKVRGDRGLPQRFDRASLPSLKLSETALIHSILTQYVPIF